MANRDHVIVIIAYLIWKGSYNSTSYGTCYAYIIAYLIWKGSYNFSFSIGRYFSDYSISDLERKL